MSKFLENKKWLVFLSLVFVVLAFPARGFIIKPTYDSSVTGLANAAQVEAAFGVAMDMITNQFTNAITVNIGVYWGSTGPFSGDDIDLAESYTSTIGSPGSFLYPQLTNALRALRNSSADSNSIASLPASDPVSGPHTWWVPRAEAKMFSFFLTNFPTYISSNDTNNDGDVTFASNTSFTFDPTNRAVAGKYDFIGVAEHEITEVLGRATLGLDAGTNYMPYDLFRFTNGARSFNPNDNNVYFSVNNGVTVQKYFNSDPSGDLQDWASSTPEDSFDAFVMNGHQLVISEADINALDVLGYNSPKIPSPHLTGPTLTNGAVWFTFTNTPGVSYTILTTTNVALSATNWTILGEPVEGPAGHFQFTDPQGATNNARFYRVSSP